MSEKISKCPNCNSISVSTLIVYNPDTLNMNCDCLFKCNDCKNEWNGQRTSEAYRIKRDRGEII